MTKNNEVGRTDSTGEVDRLKAELAKAHAMIADLQAEAFKNMQRELRGRRAADVFLEYFAGSVEQEQVRRVNETDDMPRMDLPDLDVDEMTAQRLKEAQNGDVERTQGKGSDE